MIGGSAEFGSIPLFAEVAGRPEVVAALSSSPRRCLADGEMLIVPGQQNHQLYFLLSGRLEVHLTRDGNSEGMPVTPGEPVGEISIIDGGVTSAYVWSVGRSEVLALSDGVFWRELAPHPSVLRNLSRLMTQRLRLTSERTIRSLEQQLRFEHLKRELAAAHDIQMGMLPHFVPLFPQHPQVDVHAHLAPAKEVGGDLYDAIALDDDHILVALGDVSGKGMPAALFMMRTLTLLRALADAALPAEEWLPALNRKLCEGNETDMFVTLTVAVLSVRDGRVRLFNAGHLPPCFSRQGQRFEFLDMPRGVVLGVVPHASIPRLDLRLAPGDRLVFYSDGVTEAENEGTEMFGADRLLAALDGGHGGPDAGMEAQVARLTGAVSAFIGAAEPSDDITVLALEYRDPSAGTP
jgi:sigma-B regulation protein RsbU (phosphoserine phosphatase)